MAGQLSGLYLILNGLERFFIEKIRVNTKYEDLPLQPTQAELISFVMILSGILLMFKAKDWFGKPGFKI
jgi:prolipoprotein diacylglyceryltransferase